MICFTACKTPSDFYNLPTYSVDANLQAVIEIPAGTNYKFEYQQDQNEFIIDRRKDIERKIDFLPYPGNYGFIPSTFSDPEKGGDGDALDILVLSESLNTGSVLEVIPIGMLKIEDDGELDYKIIAVPLAEKDRIIKATNYVDFTKNYPTVKRILETWFTNYDAEEVSEIKGWGDEIEAVKEITRWQRP